MFVLLWGSSVSVVLGLFAVVLLVAAWLSFRYIPNNSVGIVEKLWSMKGSVPEGDIIAMDGEAGFQIRTASRWRSFWVLAMAI